MLRLPMKGGCGLCCICVENDDQSSTPVLEVRRASVIHVLVEPCMSGRQGMSGFLPKRWLIDGAQLLGGTEAVDEEREGHITRKHEDSTHAGRGVETS